MISRQQKGKKQHNGKNINRYQPFSHHNQFIRKRNFQRNYCIHENEDQQYQKNQIY